MNIDDLNRDIESFEDREFFGPMSDAKITEASNEIGLNFPDEYVVFLRTFGAGCVSSECFVGLGGPSHLDVVWLTKTLRGKKGRRPFPETLIPVRADGFGNYDCIDTERAGPNGECSIIEWVHDASPDAVNRVLASSYFEWFKGIIQMLRRL